MSTLPIVNTVNFTAVKGYSDKLKTVESKARLLPHLATVLEHVAGEAIETLKLDRARSAVGKSFVGKAPTASDLRMCANVCANVEDLLKNLATVTMSDKETDVLVRESTRCVVQHTDDRVRKLHASCKRVRNALAKIKTAAVAMKAAV